MAEALALALKEVASIMVRYIKFEARSEADRGLASIVGKER